MGRGASVEQTVLFCARVYYTRVCVCKLSQLHTILLALQPFVMSPLPHVVDLQGLVAC